MGRIDIDRAWERIDASAAEAWTNLVLNGEHTLPDGSAIRRRAYGEYDIVAAGAAAPALPDFGSVYDLLLDEPRSLIEVAQACVTDPCPPYVDTTIAVSRPAAPPLWVRAALDRLQREWSDHLHVVHGLEPAAHRVLTYPSITGGYWLREVPNEMPLLAETMCEQCTGVGDAWAL